MQEWLRAFILHNITPGFTWIYFLLKDHKGELKYIIISQSQKEMPSFKVEKSQQYTLADS